MDTSGVSADTMLVPRGTTAAGAFLQGPSCDVSTAADVAC